MKTIKVIGISIGTFLAIIVIAYFCLSPMRRKQRLRTTMRQSSSLQQTIQSFRDASRGILPKDIGQLDDEHLLTFANFFGGWSGYIETNPKNGYESRKGICDYIYLGCDKYYNLLPAKGVSLITKPGVLPEKKAIIVVHNDNGTQYYPQMPDFLLKKLIKKKSEYSNYDKRIKGNLTLEDLSNISFDVEYYSDYGSSNLIKHSLKYNKGKFFFDDKQIPQKNVTKEAKLLLLDIVNFITNNDLDNKTIEMDGGSRGESKYVYSRKDGKKIKFSIEHSLTPPELNIFHYKLGKLVEALGHAKASDIWKRCSGAFPIKQQLEEMSILNKSTTNDVDENKE
jgi:hypothetical protein